MTSHKPKTWKAWGVFTPRGRLCDLWTDLPVAERDLPSLNRIGNQVRPVLITLAKPRRKKK